MDALLEQLHDIDGLDAIHWWPLAPGWWVILLMGIVILGAIVWWMCKKISFIRSWKNDTMQKLTGLEKELSDETIQETLITLSEYVRRIALRCFSREECAGLVGENWLKWLSQHDPKKFDWESKGKVLINAPYAPTQNAMSIQEVKSLIQAIRSWVR